MLIIDSDNRSVCVQQFHVIFSFSLKTSFFIRFVRDHFYFDIIFILKINVAFVFVSVNNGKIFPFSVIVKVTDENCHWFSAHCKVRFFHR